MDKRLSDYSVDHPPHFSEYIKGLVFTFPFVLRSSYAYSVMNFERSLNHFNEKKRKKETVTKILFKSSISNGMNTVVTKYSNLMSIFMLACSGYTDFLSLASIDKSKQVRHEFASINLNGLSPV